MPALVVASVERRQSLVRDQRDEVPLRHPLRFCRIVLAVESAKPKARSKRIPQPGLNSAAVSGFGAQSLSPDIDRAWRQRTTWDLTLAGDADTVNARFGHEYHVRGAYRERRPRPKNSAPGLVLLHDFFTSTSKRQGPVPGPPHASSAARSSDPRWPCSCGSTRRCAGAAHSEEEESSTMKKTLLALGLASIALAGESAEPERQRPSRSACCIRSPAPWRSARRR